MRKVLLATVASMGALFAAAGTASAQPVKPVAPATIVVHFNGFFQAGLDNVGSTYNNVAGSKLSPVTTNGDLRLYPGFDAMTADGLGYGVQVELRDAFFSGGKGVATSSTASGNGSLYVRRAYGYIGTPNYGYVRIGQTDGAFGLLQTGVIEQFGDGVQFANTDSAPLYTVPTKAVPGEFIYADQGALYTTDKVVLISPAIDEPYLGGKLSAIFSYEPNSNGLKEGYGSYCATAATAGCGAIASTTTYGNFNAAARRNTFDFMGQYTVKLGSFTNKIAAGMLDGQPLRYAGTAAGAGSASAYAATRLDQLQVFQFGAQTTYKGLFTDSDAVTLGANIKWGQTLDGYAAKPVGARDAFAYIIGGNYVIGPYVLGASFWDSQSAGNYNPAKAGTEARTLSEYGVSVGGNYVINKNLSLYAQWMYAHEHQPGNTNLPKPSTNTGSDNNAQMQLVSAGATLKW
ncbi:MAG: porin [Acidocella sp.]|nr:porin [Acidocella sp.]